MTATIEWNVPRHDIPTAGRSGFVLVDERQVHYLEWGRSGSPPVVCLHGGGQTAYMWEGLGAALGATHHVLAPDLPMHGDSDPVGEMSRHALAATIPPSLPLRLSFAPPHRRLRRQSLQVSGSCHQRWRVTPAWVGGS